VEGQEDGQEELPAALIEHAKCGVTVEMQNLLGMGKTMDDNKKPVPENVPTNNNDSEVVYKTRGGQQNICPCQLTIGHKKKAKLNHFLQDAHPTNLQLFELMFPTEFVNSVMLPMMNEKLEEQAIAYREWLNFVGLWFLMLTTFACNHQDFWAQSEPDKFTGAPWQLGEYMSCYCLL